MDVSSSIPPESSIGIVSQEKVLKRKGLVFALKFVLLLVEIVVK
jgi:hypothetical protein